MACRFTLLLWIVLLAPIRADAETAGFAVVCNAAAATPTLTRAEVRAIFTGKRKLVGGFPVVVVVRPVADEIFQRFVDQMFGIPVRLLLSKIQQEVFKGEMAKPLRAASDREVIQYVARSPGTIGVISALGASHLPTGVVVIGIRGG